MKAPKKVWMAGLLAFMVHSEAYAAKKDYKGLFGSYRREKFTENEARSTDYGVDLMLSTLMPVTSVVNSNQAGPTAVGTPMYYAMFMNVEASFFFTLNYHWEIFLNTGYYSYSTRKEEEAPGNPGDIDLAADSPWFHEFSLEAIPLMLGVKYRFSTSDIVPYVGLAAGIAHVTRRGSYEYDPLTFRTLVSNPLVVQGTAGVQFYISPRMGIRLEASASWMMLPQQVYDSLGSPEIYPIMTFQGNNIALRYASGLFILF